jgi:signal transduction histidine kinase
MSTPAVPDLDPIRQVRTAKLWAFAGMSWALFALLLFAAALGLPLLEMVYVLAPATAIAALAVEMAARWEARTHRRYAYPHRLGYVLAGLRDFDDACKESARLVADWLTLDAVVLGWVNEDGQSVNPVAAHGVPVATRQLKSLPSAACGLTGQNLPVARPLRGLAKDFAWFQGFERGRFALVPLVSRDVTHGVLAVAGTKSNPQLGDTRLLAAMAMVLAMALDNCRLYEGERAHARHFQELHRMKTDFLMTVSHELRTPLTSIMLAAEMLLEEEETRNPESTRGRLVRNIVKGATRLRSLVEDLVAVSREDEFQPRLELEPAPLADIVSNAVSIVQPLVAAKSQAIDTDLSPEAEFVRVDRLRFEQVLINLLSNAQRYSPPGGHIHVSSGRLARGETLISVMDTGPGVPEPECEAIFEPFYRGDRSGLGLGLAIARSIVELHGGRIWVERGERHGSRFCVAIPDGARSHLAATDARAPANDSAARSPGPVRRRAATPR